MRETERERERERERVREKFLAPDTKIVPGNRMSGKLGLLIVFLHPHTRRWKKSVRKVKNTRNKRRGIVNVRMHLLSCMVSILGSLWRVNLF